MNTALSVDFNHLSDGQLNTIIANHKNLPAEYQRVDGRAFAAMIILDKRTASRTPSKQKFIKPT